jgi:rhodanese-related sulfurtransferase
MKNISKTSRAFWGILITVLWMAAQTAWAQEFPYVTPEDLKKLIESRDPGILIVDVQPKAAYDLGHIQGAFNFPWEKDLKGNGNLPREKTLILYCDCGQEEDSTDVATQLMDKWGYTNIKLLEGSWSMWRQLGYPVEKKK